MTITELLASLRENTTFTGSLKNSAVQAYVSGTTGTGLDQVVSLIMADPELNRRISIEEIAEGARAADALNGLIVEAIKATGVANDGEFTASDMHDLNAYLQANHQARWTELHGDDEGDEETGFHLVQNDGAITRLYGDNAVNTVSDGLYHIGFDIYRDRFLNEDGNANARLESTAYWLNELLAEQLGDGSLTNGQVDPEVQGSTGTGLDRIIDMINDDTELSRRVSNEDIRGGAESADQMNAIIIDAIKATGTANNGEFTASDIYALNAYIRTNHLDTWTRLHGDDESEEETGYHLVQNDGAVARLFDQNGVNTVADGIYHLGFEIRYGRLLNEDGNSNASLEDVAVWLNSLLEIDLESGALVNPEVTPYVRGSTGTGLDQAVGLIMADPELNHRIPIEEMAEAARAADAMNTILLDAIRGTGVANDGWINAADLHDVSAYIREDAGLSARWRALHGDDDDKTGEETGFHLVQNDGAVTQLFGRNAVNSVLDGLYHIGFDVLKGRFLNEDGNSNVSLEQAADWLNDLLAEDLMAGALNNPEVDPYAHGSTNTGLDRLVEIIGADDGLNRRLATSEIATGAQAADAMNAILIEAIQATGAADNGRIDMVDMRDISAYIRDHHGDTWAELHGDDEADEESGFHRVEGDGAVSRLFDQDAVNTVADGIYHMGFEIRWGRYLNEDGNSNQRVETVMEWLNELLSEDLAAGTLMSDPVDVDALNDDLVLSLDTVTVDGRPPWGQPSGHLEVDSPAELSLANGTVAFGFTADNPLSGATQTLFSKDGAGYGGGGHLNAYLRSGKLYVRFQSEEKSYYLDSGDLQIEAEQRYDFAFSFGEDGAHLYLNGDKLDNEPQLEMSWVNNHEDLIVGASGEGRSADKPDWVWNYFDGTIEGFSVYNRALERAEVAAISQEASLLPAFQPADPDPLPDTEDAGPILAGVDLAAVYAGSGLMGEAYDVDKGFSSVSQLQDHVAEAEGPTHTFTAGRVDFGGAYQYGDLAAFLGDNGNLISGDGGSAMETMGLHFKGYIHIAAGQHRVTVRSNDGYALKLGGELFSSFESPRPFYGTNKVDDFEGGLYEIELFYFENWGSEGLRLELDGQALGAEHFYQSVEDFTQALAEHGPMPEGGLPELDPAPQGTTGTGLDQVVSLIMADPELNRRISIEEIAEGARAADALNGLIVEAIKATGVANDGEFTASDMHDLNAYLQANHQAIWTELHGDDENEPQQETGFHLVQNDGAITRLYGDNAVNTVADGLYHIGFDIYRDRFLNEDGNANARLESTAYWLNELLAEQLGDGSLTNGQVDPEVQGSTGTGLDRIIDMINDDTELSRRVSNEDIRGGAESADQMNAIIIEAIKATGTANNGEFTASDIYALNAYIRANHLDTWTRLHGDDESEEETGYHLVQNDGAVARLFDQNGVNTVADGIYHLGFAIRYDRLLNEDGNSNASLEDVAVWMNSLLEEDLESGVLVNPEVTPYVRGTTGTGLDQVVSLIMADPELNRRISIEEIAEGARAADALNGLIVEAIKATGVANDGEFTASDMHDLNAYLQANHQARWTELHGDDEGDEETGFHLVQNDGAITRLYGDNAVNTVSDGLYHIGFDIYRDRFLNEDGNANARLESTAYWLNELLAEQLGDGSLTNGQVDPEVQGSTGTGLDRIIDMINDDTELSRRVSNEDIRGGAESADQMNAIIIDAIKATGTANNGEFTASDIYALNAYIRTNHLDTWTRLHGDDESEEETGYHLVQNDGAVARLFDQNGVNTVADGIYHLGFEIRYGRLLNEDGNSNASLEDVAVWLNSLLEIDLESGALVNPEVTPYVRGSTGTGLDQAVGLIMADPELNHRIPIEEMAEAARAADAMNTILLDAIRGTGVANDGWINAADLHDVSAYIREDAGLSARWRALHGDDDDKTGEETGFHLVQNDGAVTQLFGRNAVNSVLDGLYHIGFDVLKGRFLNEDGNSNVSLEQAADWLNDLLAEDLMAGALNNPEVDPYAHGSTNTGLDRLVEIIGADDGLNRRLATSEIATGAQAADAMNAILIEAIQATGAADNGRIDMVDMRDISAYIRDHHGDTWAELHGDDEADEESGFHRVEGDGAVSRLFDQDAVNTVADGIYHMGFEIRWGRYLNEDGNSNQRVETVMEWLNELLSEDLAAGTLMSDPVDVDALNDDLVLSLDTVTVDGRPPWGQPSGHLEVDSPAELSLANGTVAFGFTADNPLSGATQTLFSKDGAGYGGGGHLNAYLRSGKLYVRFQSEEKSYYLDSGDLQIEAEQRYDFAFSFGEDGAHLYLNGDKLDNEPQLEMSWVNNHEDLIVGASGEGRSADKPDWVWNYFDGTIEGFSVYNRALERAEVAAISQEASLLPAFQPADPDPLPDTEDAGPILAGVDLAAVYAGSGLMGEAYDVDKGFSSVSQLQDHVAEAEGPTHTFTAGRVDFGGAYQYGDLAAFLGDNGNLISGDGGSAMETMGLHFKGYIHIAAGQHRVTVRSNDGYALKLGGELFSSFESPRPFYGTNKVDDFEGGLYEIELFYFENWGSEGLRLELDGQALGAEHFYQSVEDFTQALAEHGPMPEGGLPELDPAPQGTTGTGLDQVVSLIMADPELNRRISIEEIAEGARAADALNGLIVEAIKATGVANDGEFTASDMHDLNAYLQAKHQARWAELHGDDENEPQQETGFHLVQNDGAITRLYGDNAVNTVADGLYHIGFDIYRDRFLNEDGNANARLESTAYWLNELLAEQLGDGSLTNGQVDPEVQGSTGTGLDRIIDMINDDTELSRRVSNEDIREAGSAADGMNIIIAEAIQQTGLGNDGEISSSDVFDLNAYIRQHYEGEWAFLHGDDEDLAETGFHRVQNDGAVTRLFDENAINTVADGIYHMGFENRCGRFLNEDGNANASVEQVAVWLDSLLEEDLALVISGGADTDNMAGMMQSGAVEQPDYTTPYTDASAMAIIAVDESAIDVDGVLSDSALHEVTL